MIRLRHCVRRQKTDRRQGGIRQGRGHVHHGRRLEAARAQIAVQRDVQRVEPQHRHVAFVPMLVPAPCRRQDQVAIFHRARFAIDQRDRSAPFQHETERPHRMPMRPRRFAGQQTLHTGQHRTDRIFVLRPFRIRRQILQHAPLDHIGRCRGKGHLQQGPGFRPLPKMRLLRRRGRPVRRWAQP